VWSFLPALEFSQQLQRRAAAIPQANGQDTAHGPFICFGRGLAQKKLRAVDPKAA
jgi:hypothetical protein